MTGICYKTRYVGYIIIIWDVWTCMYIFENYGYTPKFWKHFNITRRLIGAFPTTICTQR
jgi:hypothetical protein